MDEMVELDGVTYHTLFLGLKKTKGIEGVSELYHTMTKTNFVLKTRTVVTLMKYFCQNSHVDLGLSLWKYMVERGYCPHSHALDLLVTGICSRGMVQEAFECSKQLLERGRHMSTASFSMMENFLLKAGQKEKLKDLDQMIKKLQSILPPSRGHTTVTLDLNFSFSLSYSAEVAYEAANAAIAGGISLVLNQLVKEHPTTAFRVCLHPLSCCINILCLSVGNVLKIEDAKAAVNAGVKFLMSPAIVKDVMYYIQNGEVLYIPGTMTPTEILSACEAGAKMVKYISAALKKPFPHVSMVASQGIKIDSIKKYISRGASAVLLSDKEAIAQRNYEKIQKLAHSAALLGNKL
ncbi:hypothetical protein AHAS_Ahas02G0106300 [Arachis hypogaea]